MPRLARSSKLSAALVLAIGGCAPQSAGPQEEDRAGIDSACAERWAELANLFDGKPVTAAVTYDITRLPSDQRRAFIDSLKQAKGFSITVASRDSDAQEKAFLAANTAPGVFQADDKVLGRIVFEAAASKDAVRRACRDIPPGSSIHQFTLGISAMARG